MKKLVDIIICVIILLIFLSYCFNGWGTVICASSAIVLAVVAFWLNKKK